MYWGLLEHMGNIGECMKLNPESRDHIGQGCGMVLRASDIEKLEVTQGFYRRCQLQQSPSLVFCKCTVILGKCNF